MDIVFNKKIQHQYFILDSFECGIVLEGSEVKSLRARKVNIEDAFVTFKGSELFITNMNISKFTQISKYFDHEERRPRKLLLHKSEILRITSQIKTKGLTCVPLKLYFKENLIKVQICLVKGKNLYDKRQTEKDREIKRTLEKEIKNWR